MNNTSLLKKINVIPPIYGYLLKKIKVIPPIYGYLLKKIKVIPLYMDIY